jgi:hypothetical protein
MARVRKAGVFLVLAAVCVFFSIAAEAASISVTNSTGVEIYYMYISASGTSDWEEDVLGNNTLPNGSTLQISVTGSYRMFDLRVEDSGGDYLEFYEFPGNTTQITLLSDGTANYQ